MSVGAKVMGMNNLEYKETDQKKSKISKSLVRKIITWLGIVVVVFILGKVAGFPSSII